MPLDKLVLALKFNSRLALAHDFARRLAVLARRHFVVNHWPDMIAPVPLSARRLAERGYNQAWEIARPLARALELIAQPQLVRRIIDTAPQAQLNKQARRSNMRRAFAVSSPSTVRGLHIAIVDDVMTSGATLDQVAQALRHAGAAQVTNLVALRTPKPYS
jgi:ComF family protein